MAKPTLPGARESVKRVYGRRSTDKKTIEFVLVLAVAAFRLVRSISRWP
jgi:hypothetical protein